MKSGVLALLVSFVPVSVASPASAQGIFGPLAIDNCSDYVARAMSQVEMGAGCNFPGPRWSPNRAEHISWCNTASPRARGEAYHERREALIRCRGDIGAIAISNCDDYASRARSEVELAQALGSSCTSKGARWSSNLVQHMNWCDRTATREHESEDAARRKELAQCRPGPGKN